MQNCNTNVAWRSGPSVRWIKASINCEPDEKVPKKCGDVWILKIKHGVYDYYKFSFEWYRISYFLIRYIFGSTYAIKSWETQEKQVIDLKILYIYLGSWNNAERISLEMSNLFGHLKDSCWTSWVYRSRYKYS